MVNLPQFSPAPYVPSNTSGGLDEERWHVVLGPNDLRVMTLDQLDDAYRLSLVDDSTNVWKAGMSAWAPLGVVAGVETDPSPSLPAPPFVSPPAFAPAPRFVPGSLAPPAMPVLGAPDLSAELRVIARSGRRPLRWLYAFLLLAAAAAAAFRNDALRSAAKGVGAASIYAQLETAVTGQPGFGTPRAVESLVARTSALVPDLRAMRAARVKLPVATATLSTVPEVQAAAPPVAPVAPRNAGAAPSKAAAPADKGANSAGKEHEASPFATPSGGKGKKQKLDDHDPLNPNL